MTSFFCFLNVKEILFCVVWIGTSELSRRFLSCPRFSHPPHRPSKREKEHAPTTARAFFALFYVRRIALEEPSLSVCCKVLTVRIVCAPRHRSTNKRSCNRSRLPRTWTACTRPTWRPCAPAGPGHRGRRPRGSSRTSTSTFRARLR